MSPWGQTMLLWSWQSLLLVIMVLVVSRIARSQSAASRHSFWLLAVLGILVLPGVTALVRKLPVAPPVVAPIAYIAQLPAVTVETLPTTVRSAISARDLAIPLLFAIWTAGVLVSGARSVRAHRRWRRIVRTALSAKDTRLSIPVGYSAEVDAPVLVGVLRPMIVLPANIEAWTNADERNAVLLHELAHVERRDHWMGPVQVVLGAVFFFHPAVRYALRQLILERELACDEYVLSAGTSPSTYAEIILRVAERSIPGRQTDCPAFNSPGKTLERRIEMILSHRTLVAGRWRFPAIGKMTIVLGLALLLLPQYPMIAETPLPPPPAIQVATLEPLMQSMSAIATAFAPEASVKLIRPAVVEPAPQAAQAESGTVSGTVSDPSGAVVPGVSVTLISPNGQDTKMTVSNNTGAFVLNQIAPGEWTLQAKLPGFTNIERRIPVRSGEVSVQNVALTIAGVSTTVSVTASRSTALQNPTNAPPPQRIGGVVSQPNLISQVKPVYPASARASGVQDYVQLQAVIGKDGSVISVQVDPNRLGIANADLTKAAIDAVQQWRYRPGMLNGAAIEVATTITVNFTLE